MTSIDQEQHYSPETKPRQPIRAQRKARTSRVAEVGPPPADGLAENRPTLERRSPPAAIKVLLPAWGMHHVRVFLEFCLPTLLAPGNVPALAKALPCTFVVMTSLEDAPVIREHPTWRRLEAICPVEVKLIDDLITDGNHTTTITLAYARAVRETGLQSLDTLFIFLVSDYLVADGSLANVLAHLQAGASGVLAGNFQIVAEDAMPLLRRRIDATKVEIALPPRELLSWTLGQLHPATMANIVNFTLTHNEHANRLFWRVDENTLIGRFYLMHMIGIRPEVTNFVVGSSCDYSFIPEMCPSNNVVVIKDSDEYLVLELQPRDHESHDLRLGPFDPKHLAATLSEWTTARHRENVQHTLVYHAADIPNDIAEGVADANTFVDTVARNLTVQPQPHRSHPYWLGAITAHRSAIGQAQSANDLNPLLGQATEQATGIISLLWRIRIAMYGIPPDVKASHPRWPDFRLPLDGLQEVVAERGRLLIVSNAPQVYRQWLAKVSMDSISIETERLLSLSRPRYTELIDSFDACLLCLAEGDLKRAKDFLERVGPLLKRGGKVLVFTTNDRKDDLGGFGPSLAYHAARLGNMSLWLSRVQFVGMSSLRWKVQQLIVRLARTAARRPLLYFPLAAVGGAFLMVVSYFCNRSALRTDQPPTMRFCSSVFMVLRRSENPTRLPLPPFKSDRDAREGLLKQPRDGRSEPLPAIIESQTEDAHRRDVILARYKFVANLLSGRHDVCECGRSHPLGIRVVLPKVEKIAVYDSDRCFIEKFRRQYRDVLTLKAEVYDIVGEHLPRSHDSIYSFDVLDRIAPEDEDNFMRHLRDSLSRDCDVAVIGCSSPDYDTVAWSGSASEPIYTRTGAKFKALMERGFNAVMLFSMTEEVIQPGISSTAQYFMALCCARKH
jgi:hypothetical protein